jgi:hypothetical protein
MSHYFVDFLFQTNNFGLITILKRRKLFYAMPLLTNDMSVSTVWQKLKNLKAVTTTQRFLVVFLWYRGLLFLVYQNLCNILYCNEGHVILGVVIFYEIKFQALSFKIFYWFWKQIFVTFLFSLHNLKNLILYHAVR